MNTEAQMHTLSSDVHLRMYISLYPRVRKLAVVYTRFRAHAPRTSELASSSVKDHVSSSPRRHSNTRCRTIVDAIMAGGEQKQSSIEVYLARLTWQPNAVLSKLSCQCPRRSGCGQVVAWVVAV